MTDFFGWPGRTPGRRFQRVSEFRLLRVVRDAWLEPALRTVAPGRVVQFERLGYFVADRVLHRAEEPVFNRVVSLRDAWAKLEEAGGPAEDGKSP